MLRAVESSRSRSSTEARDDVREPADARRRRAADGQVEELLGDLRDPLEDRAAPREHQPAAMLLS